MPQLPVLGVFFKAKTTGFADGFSQDLREVENGRKDQKSEQSETGACHTGAWENREGNIPKGKAMFSYRHCACTIYILQTLYRYDILITDIVQVQNP